MISLIRATIWLRLTPARAASRSAQLDEAPGAGPKGAGEPERGQPGDDRRDREPRQRRRARSGTT